MRQKVIWFMIGVLLGGVFFAGAYNDSESSCGCNMKMNVLHASEKAGYNIAGPYNWTPRPVIMELPSNFISQLRDKMPGLLEKASHVGTIILKNGSAYSLFKEENGETWYVQWNEKGKLSKAGRLKFKLIENSTIVKSRNLGFKARAVETLHIEKFQAENPQPLATIYIVTAWKEYTWSLGGSEWTKTVAKGKFWVDYGNEVLSVTDLSYEDHEFGVIKCSFSSHTSGVGTVEAGVYADASYMFWDFISPVADHWDSHARVFVDAWTNVDDDAWGTKWLGLPAC